MLNRWNDFNRTFTMLDEFQRRMSRLFSEFDTYHWPEGEIGRTMMTWPRTNLYDHGKDLILHAEVPGLSEKDININANQEMLTISGERKSEMPEGYSTHRQERGQVRFSRSFTFPCKVDLEQTTASVKNGILTVTLPKAPESQPRQITVKAQ
jgi:HSP20 family protein